MIAQLITDTVAQSSDLSPTEAEDALAAAVPVGRMLIAGGHLDRHPITLIAGIVHWEITTMSGAAALAHEENLNPIPGAASAESFTIYLPSPAPLQDLVAAAAARHPRLDDADPPTPPPARTAAGSELLLDLAALRRAARR